MMNNDFDAKDIGIGAAIALGAVALIGGIGYGIYCLVNGDKKEETTTEEPEKVDAEVVEPDLKEESGETKTETTEQQAQ